MCNYFKDFLSSDDKIFSGRDVKSSDYDNSSEISLHRKH